MPQAKADNAYNLKDVDVACAPLKGQIVQMNKPAYDADTKALTMDVFSALERELSAAKAQHEVEEKRAADDAARAGHRGRAAALLLLPALAAGAPVELGGGWSLARFALLSGGAA